MHKPAGVQIDERVYARFNSKMDSAVPVTVQNILVDNLNPTAFKKNGSRKHKKKHGSKFDNKNTSQVFINNLSNNLLGSTAFGYTILPCQFAQPASSGIANEGQNIQNVTIPADQRPFLNFTKLRGGGSSYRGPGWIVQRKGQTQLRIYQKSR